MSIVSFINGHTSFETAYAVENYPYGFKERTTMYYWIETKAGKGDRLVTATINPKNGKLNKPKASTYSTFLVLYLNENGHVKQTGVSFYEVAKNQAIFDFLLKEVKIENISKVQQENIRAAFKSHWYAHLYYNSVKYTQESHAEYIKAMNEHLAHIKTADFAQINNLPPLPEETKPDGKLEFKVTEYSIIG
jgi:hypothetical protein